MADGVWKDRSCILADVQPNLPGKSSFPDLFPSTQPAQPCKGSNPGELFISWDQDDDGHRAVGQARPMELESCTPAHAAVAGSLDKCDEMTWPGFVVTEAQIRCDWPLRPAPGVLRLGRAQHAEQQSKSHS